MNFHKSIHVLLTLICVNSVFFTAFSMGKRELTVAGLYYQLKFEQEYLKEAVKAGLFQYPVFFKQDMQRVYSFFGSRILSSDHDDAMEEVAQIIKLCGIENKMVENLDTVRERYHLVQREFYGTQQLFMLNCHHHSRAIAKLLMETPAAIESIFAILLQNFSSEQNRLESLITFIESEQSNELKEKIKEYYSHEYIDLSISMKNTYLHYTKRCKCPSYYPEDYYLIKNKIAYVPIMFERCGCSMNYDRRDCPIDYNIELKKEFDLALNRLISNSIISVTKKLLEIIKRDTLVFIFTKALKNNETMEQCATNLYKQNLENDLLPKVIKQLSIQVDDKQSELLQQILKTIITEFINIIGIFKKTIKEKLASIVVEDAQKINSNYKDEPMYWDKLLEKLPGIKEICIGQITKNHMLEEVMRKDVLEKYEEEFFGEQLYTKYINKGIAFELSCLSSRMKNDSAIFNAFKVYALEHGAFYEFDFYILQNTGKNNLSTFYIGDRFGEEFDAYIEKEYGFNIANKLQQQKELFEEEQAEIKAQKQVKKKQQEENKQQNKAKQNLQQLDQKKAERHESVALLIKEREQKAILKKQQEKEMRRIEEQNKQELKKRQKEDQETEKRQQEAEAKQTNKQAAEAYNFFSRIGLTIDEFNELEDKNEKKVKINTIDPTLSVHIEPIVFWQLFTKIQTADSNEWITQAGVRYNSYTAKHVILHSKKYEHALKDAVEQGTAHSRHLFNTKDDKETFNLIDEAWEKCQDKNLVKPNVYEVDMGRVIGTSNEYTMRLVGTKNYNEFKIITAYPIYK